MFLFSRSLRLGSRVHASFVSLNVLRSFSLPSVTFSFGQRFFFKSQVIAANKFDISKCDDFVWVTKDELLEYFPEQAEFLNQMIIS